MGPIGAARLVACCASCCRSWSRCCSPRWTPPEPDRALVALVVGITFHEFMHAYVADQLGDHRPRAMGRVSLNPTDHIDPIGAIFFLVAGFGWGKPVMVNPYALRPGRLGMAYVAARRSARQPGGCLGAPSPSAAGAGRRATSRSFVWQLLFAHRAVQRHPGALQPSADPAAGRLQPGAALPAAATARSGPALRAVWGDPAAACSCLSWPGENPLGGAARGGAIPAHRGAWSVHRVEQFFGHVRASVTPSETALAQPAAGRGVALFTAMPVADRRHALDVVERLMLAGMTTPTCSAPRCSTTRRRATACGSGTGSPACCWRRWRRRSCGAWRRQTRRSWRHPFHLYLHHAADFGRCRRSQPAARRASAPSSVASRDRGRCALAAALQPRRRGMLSAMPITRADPDRGRVAADSSCAGGLRRPARPAAAPDRVAPAGRADGAAGGDGRRVRRAPGQPSGPRRRAGRLRGDRLPADPAQVEAAASRRAAAAGLVAEDEPDEDELRRRLVEYRALRDARGRCSASGNGARRSSPRATRGRPARGAGGADARLPPVCGARAPGGHPRAGAAAAGDRGAGGDHRPADRDAARARWAAARSCCSRSWPRCQSRTETAVTVLAMLELVRRRQATAQQDELFGPIVVRPTGAGEPRDERPARPGRFLRGAALHRRTAAGRRPSWRSWPSVPRLQVEAALAALGQRLEDDGRGLRLQRLDEEWQLVTAPELGAAWPRTRRARRRGSRRPRSRRWRWSRTASPARAPTSIECGASTPTTSCARSCIAGWSPRSGGGTRPAARSCSAPPSPSSSASG